MLHKNVLLKASISVIAISAIAGSTWGLAVVETRTAQPLMRDSPEHNNANTHVEVESYMQSHSHAQPRSMQDNSSQLTFKQMEALQREISELRGLVEEQDHYIKQLKKSQQDLYLDLDRRLNQAHAGTKKDDIQAAELPKAKPEAKPASMKPSTTAKANINPILRPVSPLPEKPAKGLRVQPGVAVTSKIDNSAPSAPPKPQVVLDVATKAPASFPNEKAHYDAAYELVRTKHYTEALTTFESYLQNYPNGENIVNAYYWIGEVYRVRWQSEKTNLPLLERAGDAFATITIQFPNHAKAADATLKLGLIEQDKGNLDVARQYFADVREHFPGTAAARLAEARLQQLN